MRARHLFGIGAAMAAIVAFGFDPSAQDSDVRARYERAESLARRTQGLVYNQAETPRFLPDSAMFYYRKTVKGGNEFVFVDPAAGTKAAAFDHARLAAAINGVAGEDYTAVTLPFTAFNYLDNRQAVEFTIGGGGGGRGGRQGGGAPVLAPGQPRWRCTLTDYTCTRSAAPVERGAEQAGQGRGAGGRGGGIGSTINAVSEPPVRVSPDEAWEALIRNHNIYVRPARRQGEGRRGGGRGQAAAAEAADGFLLSTDGSEGNSYTFQSIAWSPDSKKLAAFRRRPGTSGSSTTSSRRRAIRCSPSTSRSPIASRATSSTSITRWCSTSSRAGRCPATKRSSPIHSPTRGSHGVTTAGP